MGAPSPSRSISTTGGCNTPLALMEAAKASMVAGLCGVFLAFFGEALSRLSGTVISEPCCGAVASVAAVSMD